MDEILFDKIISELSRLGSYIEYRKKLINAIVDIDTKLRNLRSPGWDSASCASHSESGDFRKYVMYDQKENLTLELDAVTNYVKYLLMMITLCKNPWSIYLTNRFLYQKSETQARESIHERSRKNVKKGLFKEFGYIFNDERYGKMRDLKAEMGMLMKKSELKNIKD